ncbi:MAG: hypothetical protein RIQ88_224 [Actinomycetota bacterium]|jgi:predicted SprT family Zn-dependent metalloprotease
MISTASKASPQAQATGMVFNAVGESSWEIYREDQSQIIGKLAFESFGDRGPSAFLRVEQSSHGTISWLAEAIRLTLDYGFDELKLARVSVRAKAEQLSLLAALEDLGFVVKSQIQSGVKMRLQADRWSYISALAESMMLEHIEEPGWIFGFDNGRRRAGLCSYTDKKITVSKYLSLVHSVDDVRQTILHEIAHAIAGPKEGHGKKWLAIAKRIGYRNEVYTGEEIAQEYAPYIGLCPNGHKHYRYQKPKRLYSCHLCARGFNKQYMIDWMARS